MKYDVIVAGAGSAGFAAAVSAARCGKKVLLLDSNAAPGGVTVFSGCPVFTQTSSVKNQPLRGIFKEFIGELGNNCFPVGGYTRNTSEFDIQLVMSRMLKKAGVDMLFYAVLIDAETVDGKIQNVTVFCCGKKLTFEADYFVDATGDATLADLAGCPTDTPNVQDSMTKTLLFRVSNVSGFDKPKLKEIFKTLTFPYPWQDNFMGTRIGRDGDDILINLTAVSGLAMDPFDRSRMDFELREQVDVIFNWIRKNLPGFENCRLAGVSPSIGVRSSRFIIGKSRITCKDLDENIIVPDPVAEGKRMYGDHFVDRFRSPWANNFEGSYGVPYTALQAEHITNLLAAGRCISVEPRAATSIRLAPCCMATGQAAGVAAALGIPSYEVLKQKLTELDAL